jgi:hypothetical protein
MDEYRIVTKGGRFRVQRRLLWWWVFCHEYLGEGYNTAVEFDTQAEAAAWLDKQRALDDANRQEWVPAKASPPPPPPPPPKR